MLQKWHSAFHYALWYGSNALLNCRLGSQHNTGSLDVTRYGQRASDENDGPAIRRRPREKKRFAIKYQASSCWVEVEDLGEVKLPETTCDMLNVACSGSVQKSWRSTFNWNLPRDANDHTNGSSSFRSLCTFSDLNQLLYYFAMSKNGL